MKQVFCVYKYRKPYTSDKECIAEFSSREEAEKAIERAVAEKLDRFYGFEIEEFEEEEE